MRYHWRTLWCNKLTLHDNLNSCGTYAENVGFCNYPPKITQLIPILDEGYWHPGSYMLPICIYFFCQQMKHLLSGEMLMHEVVCDRHQILTPWCPSHSCSPRCRRKFLEIFVIAPELNLKCSGEILPVFTPVWVDPIYAVCYNYSLLINQIDKIF